MIRIDRAGEPIPATLTASGPGAVQAHAATLQRGGTLEFDNEIYGADDVKEALIRTQHGKCAFCESKVTATSYGDVEHFRPKAAYTQSSRQRLQRPGYWWLAYTWENLVFACQKCNQRHKRNMFPISGTRATTPAHSLTAERASFVHPVDEDPADHIKFSGPDIDWARCSARGVETARALGLDRSLLSQERKRVSDTINSLFDSIVVLGELRASQQKIDEKWAELGRYTKFV